MRDPPAGQDEHFLLIAKLGQAVCPSWHRDGLLGAVAVDKGGRFRGGGGLGLLRQPSVVVVGVVFSRRRCRLRRRRRMLLLPLGCNLDRGLFLLALGHLVNLAELASLKGTRIKGAEKGELRGGMRRNGETNGELRESESSPVLTSVRFLSVGAAVLFRGSVFSREKARTTRSALKSWQRVPCVRERGRKRERK